MSKLQEALASGKFTVTGEIGPPKGTNIEPLIHEAQECLKSDSISAVNVTDERCVDPTRKDLRLATAVARSKHKDQH